MFGKLENRKKLKFVNDVRKKKLIPDPKNSMTRSK